MGVQAGYSRLSANPPVISVIIPYYEEFDKLKRCLSALVEQTFSKNQFEVIVADNNPGDGPVEIDDIRRVLGDFARVVPAPVPGAGPARNAAVEVARGRFLAFTDQDCQPEPIWLERGYHALLEGDLVAGKVAVVCEDPARPTAVESFERVFAFDVQRYVQKEGFAVTANMLVSRDVFVHVGGFRRQLPEDKDWGQRAVAAGFRWSYRPDVAVRHPARHDWAELKQKWKRSTEADFLLMVGEPNGRARWLIRSFLVLGSPFLHWVKIARALELATAEQRLGAIGILFRIRFWRFAKSVRLVLVGVEP